MTRLALILLLSIIPNIGWACTCMTVSKKDAKRISKRADYVLLGTAVENVHHNDSIKEYWDNEQIGTHVKFKVEKVYKGQIEAEFVFINQFETGNCIQSFQFGEKYIVVATAIKKFENVRPFSEDLYKEDGIFEASQPPPPPPIGGPTINKMKCYNIEMELVDHWNEIVEKEIVVYTNQCASFYAESTSAKYFIK